MNKEVIKCIYKYMQELKIRINETKIDIEIYDNMINNATSDEQKLSIEYNKLYSNYIVLKIEYYLRKIFIFGRSYYLDFYKCMINMLEIKLDELDEGYDNIIECLGIYEQEKNNLNKTLKVYVEYLEQIEMFMKFLHSIEEDERKLEHII